MASLTLARQATRFIASLLPKEVTERLNAPINPNRIVTRKDDPNSYVEGYDIRAQLIRMFGYGGWSGEVLETVPIFEKLWHDEGGERPKKGGGTYIAAPSDRLSVGYRARYQLTIYAHRPIPGTEGGLERVEVARYTESATGDALNFPQSKWGDAHDFALKTAETQAMKRCAINLGDQFGLSLYAKGNEGAPLVRRVMQGVEYEQVSDDIDKVQPELQAVVPPEDEPWVSLAAGVFTVDAFDDLYNRARAAKAKPQTLVAMRKAASDIPGLEG